MRRRDFLATAATAAAFARGRQLAALGRAERAPLVMPPVYRPDGKRLIGSQVRADIAPGVQANAWVVGDGSRQAASATIRVRRGDLAQIAFQNKLPQQSILHWHGLAVPEAADGAPRLAIETSASYRYEFPILNPAGTHGYHAHRHHHTGAQLYRGMAGVFLISVADEDALRQPVGAVEMHALGLG